MKIIFEYTEDLNAQAENGDQDAQFAIAMCFDHGYGIVKDPFEAIPWYKKAAEQGTLMHSYRLGELYGDNEQKDQAKSWYLKAAKKGHREAMYTLGGFFPLTIPLRKTWNRLSTGTQKLPSSDMWQRRTTWGVFFTMTLRLCIIQNLLHPALNRLQVTVSP